MKNLQSFTYFFNSKFLSFSVFNKRKSHFPIAMCCVVMYVKKTFSFKISY